MFFTVDMVGSITQAGCLSTERGRGGWFTRSEPREPGIGRRDRKVVRAFGLQWIQGAESHADPHLPLPDICAVGGFIAERSDATSQSPRSQVDFMTI